MFIRRFHGISAVVEGERYGLDLLSKNTHLVHWIPTCYKVADHEFQNPNNVIFEYNFKLNKVTKHTIFSKYISDLAYYSNIINLPFKINLNILSFILALFLFLF